MRRALAAAALAAVAVLSGCTADDDGGGTAPEPAFADTVIGACPEQPGQPAAGGETLPALVLDCPAGGTFDTGRAPGVPTVVNLWASWCGPCREELPLFQQLADRAGDRVGVIGVISRDGAPQAAAFAEEAGATIPGAFDGDGALMAELGLNVLPVTYLLDADGGVVHVQLQPVESVDQLVALVAEHLGVQL